MIKDNVIQESEYNFTLPKEVGMLCDVKALLSCELFESSDEGLWEQAKEAASVIGAKEVHLSPDCHLGYGIPIGCTLVTDDTLVMDAVGFDISCGMCIGQVNGLKAKHVASVEKREEWIRQVTSLVAIGAGYSRPSRMPEFTDEKVEDILHTGIYGTWELLHPERHERMSLPVDGDYFNPELFGDMVPNAGLQLGSLGGGNHFIELLVDPQSNVWVMIHCGSRGLGHKTATYFFNAYKEKYGTTRGSSPKKRVEGLSVLQSNATMYKQYIAHHNACANYAIANRYYIMKAISKATQEVFYSHVDVRYDISHNLMQKENGFNVHRKGATRAFPAGHPDLALTKWSNTGHPCLIPGSMLEGAAIVFPGDNAKNAGYSVNHGAGRVMGRKNALKVFEEQRKSIEDEMRYKTVVCTDGTEVHRVVTNKEKFQLDECGKCYKDLGPVLNVLERTNTGSVSNRLFPVANIKG